MKADLSLAELMSILIQYKIAENIIVCFNSYFTVYFYFIQADELSYFDLIEF